MIKSEKSDSRLMVAEKSPTVRPISATRFVLHPAFRDFVFTGAATTFTVIAATAVISILGKSVGATLLAEYLLLRRMASWFQSGVQVPSAVALPRFVAFNIDESGLVRQTYFVAATLTSGGIALLLGVVLLFWHIPLSRLMFGSSDLAHLMVPLALMLIGLAIHGAVFGYYQGTLAMGKASALQLLNLVIIPILATFFLKSKFSIPWIVNTIAISMCVVSVIFTFPIVRRWEPGFSLWQLRSQSLELLSYGSVRILGDIGIQAMLGLPSVVAAHYFPIASVSALLLGGSFLTVMGAASLPLGNILLSRVSRSIAQMRTDQLRFRVSIFVEALIELSVFACLQMLVFSDVIIRLWVGPTFLEGIRVIQITILAVPFYFVHAGLRSVIDAAAIRAYNTQNIIISAVTFLLTIPIINSTIPRDHLLEALAGSSVLGMAVLAFCTLRTVRHLIRPELRLLKLFPGLCVVILLGVLSFVLRQSYGWTPTWVTLAGYELLVGIAYLCVIRVLCSSWLAFVLNSIFPSRALGQE
jgi:O-antigen/teichoic acid export membrane protein